MFLDESGVQTELGGDSGDLARVVGLDAPDGDEGIAALGDGVGNEVSGRAC